MPDPVPAIRKVLDALATLPVPVIGDRKFVDRSEREPLEPGELPGATFHVADVQFGLYQDMTLHTATILVSFVSGQDAAGSIDPTNQVALAQFIAAVHADRTLSGRLQSLEEQSVSGTDENGVDAGASVLTLLALFFTPRGDLNTIVGQAGATF